MLPTANAIGHESFFADAIGDVEIVKVAIDDPGNRSERLEAEVQLDTKIIADEISNRTVTKPMQMSDQSPQKNVPPQAMLIFVLGEDRFSNTFELGILNEHPAVLDSITSKQCLGTSAFLNPALRAVMAELHPSMMVQIAIRLTALTLRLVAGILPVEGAFQCDGPSGVEQEQLSQLVQNELDQALPYHEWQGSINYYGRVQYLMALLEESLRVLAVPMDSFAEAMKLDPCAARARRCVRRAIRDLGQTSTDVCGVWAAKTLFSAPAPDAASSKLTGRQTEKAVASKVSPDAEPEDELPSTARLLATVRKEHGRPLSTKSVPAQIGPGSPDNPLCLSDTEVDDETSPLPERSEPINAPRQSCRTEARKKVNYSVRHHPQDQDIPFARRRARNGRRTTTLQIVENHRSNDVRWPMV